MKVDIRQQIRYSDKKFMVFFVRVLRQVFIYINNKYVKGGFNKSSGF